MLPSRTTNDGVGFDTKYFRDWMTVWRDLEFLQVVLNRSAYTLTDAQLDKIFSVDIPVLRGFVVKELNPDAPLPPDLGPTALPNVYAIAGYYRDLEWTEKIVSCTSVPFLGAVSAEIGTDPAKLALLQTLIVIGEGATKKNLMPYSRSLAPNIPWRTLVDLRDKLAHFERTINPTAPQLNTILTADPALWDQIIAALKQINTDMTAVKTQLLTLQTTPDGFTAAVNTHFTSLLPTRVVQDPATPHPTYIPLGAFSNNGDLLPQAKNTLRGLPNIHMHATARALEVIEKLRAIGVATLPINWGRIAAHPFDEVSFRWLPRARWEACVRPFFTDDGINAASDMMCTHKMIEYLPLICKTSPSSVPVRSMSFGDVLDLGDEELNALIASLEPSWIEAETLKAVEICCVRQSPVCVEAIEYLMSAAWQCVSYIPEATLSTLPALYASYLRTMRNMAEHGCIYLDLSPPGDDVFSTLHYASFFVEHVEPCLRTGAALPPVGLGTGTCTATYQWERWSEYYVAGMDRVLPLRLSDKNFEIVESAIINDWQLSCTVSTKAVTSATVIPMIYKAADKSPHWVGAVVKSADAKERSQLAYYITYIDPENNSIPPAIVRAVTSALPAGAIVKFEQRMVKPQSYSNNCGPELIEHFAELLTGSRVAEDLVPAYHSELLAGYLWQEAGYLTKEVALITADEMDYSSHALIMPQAYSHSAPQSFSTSVFQTLNSWVNTQPLSSYVRRVMYRQELTHLRYVLHTHGITMSATEALTSKGFRAAALTLHPDKGGRAEDFAFVQDLKTKFEQPIDLKPILDLQLPKAQSALHTTTKGFKALDVAVDATRLYQDPTLHHAKELALSAVHLVSLCTGSKLAVVPAIASVAHTGYEQGLIPALQEASWTALYIAAPVVLYAANPYLGLAYTVGMTGLTAYDAVSNAYDLYLES